METGWAGDGAVQDQIDATVKDAIKRVRSQLPQGPSLRRCEGCDVEIPEARRKAVPGVRLCGECQKASDAGEAVAAGGYNHRGRETRYARGACRGVVRRYGWIRVVPE